MKYLFTLGHQPHLSAAEIEAVFLLRHENIKLVPSKIEGTLKH